MGLKSLRNYLGAEFVVRFSSRSQFVNFLKWKHHSLSKNIVIFHSNDDLFTQYHFLNEKKVSFNDFFMMTWERENEREKTEPQIPRQRPSQGHGEKKH